MTALTAVFDAKRKDGKLVSYPMGAAKKIYKGALVSVLQSTGGAQPGADTASTSFVGVAHETVDNTSGSLGTLSIRVEKSGVFTYGKASAVATDVGKACMITDDNNVALTSNNSIAAGYIVGLVDSSHVQVRIDGKVN
jgi:hypothetical protein